MMGISVRLLPPYVEVSFSILLMSLCTNTDTDMYGRLKSYVQVHAHSTASSQPNPPCV